MKTLQRDAKLVFIYPREEQLFLKKYYTVKVFNIYLIEIIQYNVKPSLKVHP